jgi:hypothetical protein
MDYSEAYIRAFHNLREAYNKVNSGDLEAAEVHAADVLLAAKVLLAEIQDKK